MYLNYVYDMDRHGGLVTAEPHWARNENAHAVVSVRKAGKEMKEMTHTYVVYVQLTKKSKYMPCRKSFATLAPGTRARIRRARVKLRHGKSNGTKRTPRAAATANQRDQDRTELFSTPLIQLWVLSTGGD